MRPVALAVLVVLAVILIAGWIWLVRRTPAQPCMSDATCPAGQSCVGGVCVSPSGSCVPACTPPQVCQNSQCVTPSGVCVPACVPPQVCRAGTCVTPPPASCYSWVSWGPGAPVPAGALVTPDNTQTPAALAVGNTACLGATNIGDGSLASTMGPPCSGHGPPLSLLVRDPACTAPVATTADPLRAVIFNGSLVCIGGPAPDGYTLTPYSTTSGTCGGWRASSYGLLLNDTVPPSRRASGRAAARG